MQIVWYFDEPTIGYCPECDCLAAWDSVHGLHCPKCRTTRLALFKWDTNSNPPE